MYFEHFRTVGDCSGRSWSSKLRSSNAASAGVGLRHFLAFGESFAGFSGLVARCLSNENSLGAIVAHFQNYFFKADSCCCYCRRLKL